MSVKIVHNSLLGGVERVASRMKYDYTKIQNYRYAEGDRIVFLSRNFFTTDNIWELKNFLIFHKEIIIGVIIIDDMNYGKNFASCSKFFGDIGLPIIDIVDSIIDDDTIERWEGEIDRW